MEAKTPALDVALAAGLDVRPKGSRSWACCPLHGEKTASLCFFPDGRWHCFSCGKGGDDADLYAALHNVALGEALRAVRGPMVKNEYRAPTKADQARILRQRVEAWKGEHWAEEFRRFNAARRARRLLERLSPPEDLQDNDIFWDILQQEAHALDILNLLEAATPRQLIHMMGGSP